METRDSITNTTGVHFDYFAGERRKFRLPAFGELRLLQDKHDIGPLGFEALFRQGLFKDYHVRDVIKYALIGGGMSESESDGLVSTQIVEGKILQHVFLAHMIILVTLGPENPEEKKPEGVGDGEEAETPSNLDHMDSYLTPE